MANVVDKVLRLGEGKKLKVLRETVSEVSALEDVVAPLSDKALAAKTLEFKERHNEGEGESLEDLLPEAFAVAREAARRATDMRPFDVQVMGAAALHQGSIAVFQGTPAKNNLNIGLKNGMKRKDHGFRILQDGRKKDQPPPSGSV